MNLSYLIAEYKCYLANSRYFARSPDVSGWPNHWREVHEQDYSHANFWWARAEVIKEEIRQELGYEQVTEMYAQVLESGRESCLAWPAAAGHDQQNLGSKREKGPLVQPRARSQGADQGCRGRTVGRCAVKDHNAKRAVEA